MEQTVGALHLTKVTVISTQQRNLHQNKTKQKQKPKNKLTSLEKELRNEKKMLNDKDFFWEN